MPDFRRPDYSTKENLYRDTVPVAELTNLLRNIITRANEQKAARHHARGGTGEPLPAMYTTLENFSEVVEVLTDIGIDRVGEDIAHGASGFVIPIGETKRLVRVCQKGMENRHDEEWKNVAFAAQPERTIETEHYHIDIFNELERGRVGREQGEKQAFALAVMARIFEGAVWDNRLPNIATMPTGIAAMPDIPALIDLAAFLPFGHDKDPAPPQFVAEGIRTFGDIFAEIYGGASGVEPYPDLLKADPHFPGLLIFGADLLDYNQLFTADPPEDEPPHYAYVRDLFRLMGIEFSDPASRKALSVAFLAALALELLEEEVDDNRPEIRIKIYNLQRAKNPEWPALEDVKDIRAFYKKQYTAELAPVREKIQAFYDRIRREYAERLGVTQDYHRIIDNDGEQPGGFVNAARMRGHDQESFQEAVRRATDKFMEESDHSDEKNSNFGEWRRTVMERLTRPDDERSKE